jgi:hypothetical protein
VTAITPFVDPDPFQELSYPNTLAAKMAIADYLNTPLVRLPAEAIQRLDEALTESLRKADVINFARTHLKPVLGE